MKALGWLVWALVICYLLTGAYTDLRKAGMTRFWSNTLTAVALVICVVLVSL